MKSSESPSPDSNDLITVPDPLRLAGSDATKSRRRAAWSADRWRTRSIGWSQWPVLLLIPALIAMVQAAAIVPFLHLFLGEAFQLSGGREAPWAGGLAIVGLVGFYSTVLIGKLIGSDRVAQILQILAWAGASILWLWTIPEYDISGLLTDPGSLIHDHAYMIPAIFLSMAAWWQGMRYASEPALIAAEEIRAMLLRCWIVLLAGIVFAAMADNVSADAAISGARIAVPVALIGSFALSAAAETHTTREVARARGAKGPQWDRWARLMAMVGGITLVVSVIVIVLLGPGALAAAIDGIVWSLRMAGLGVAYVVFAIFYLIYQVFRAVFYLIKLIFGDVGMLPAEMPAQPGGFGMEPVLPQEGEQSELPYLDVIRWVALGIALLIVGIIVFRIRRRRTAIAETTTSDESRESVFSGGLLRNQLRNLFRRNPRPGQLRELDLSGSPATVREGFVFLEVLANRQLVSRGESETASDFVHRLRSLWPGIPQELGDVNALYLESRYGETPDTDSARQRMQSAWSGIWSLRKDWEPPEDEDEEA